MTAAASSQDLLPADLAMGTVMLKVGDMKLMTDYYQRALGLEVVAEQDGGALPWPAQKARWSTWPPPPGSTSRPGARPACSTRRCSSTTRPHWPPLSPPQPSTTRGLFTGSADHLVSEAFYFSDPEGNGIELYWDRPREDWSWDGTEVVMDSLALPPQRYLQDTPDRRIRGRAAGHEAGVGHVHLQVGDVQSAHDFYVGTLGFEKTAGWHGQALFVSAGRYHHHMAMNVWNSRGAGPRRDTLGLGEVLIEVPSGDDVGALADRLKVAGVASHHTGAELRFEDPWRNRIRVAVR